MQIKLDLLRANGYEISFQDEDHHTLDDGRDLGEVDAIYINKARVAGPSPEDAIKRILLDVFPHVRHDDALGSAYSAVQETQTFDIARICK
jgi:hypothetical protein